MKKLILGLFLVGSIHFGTAQTKENSEIALIMKEYFGKAITTQLDPVKEQIAAMLPEESFKLFSKELDDYMPSLFDKMAVVMVKYYTPAEVKQISESKLDPVNKKLNEKLAEKVAKNDATVQSEMNTITTEWSMGLQGILMKYVPQE